MPSIGPQLPPSLTKRKRDSDDAPNSPPAKVHATEQSRVANKNEISLGYDSDNDDDDDDDDFGPSAAPAPTAPQPKPKPSIGPTLPPSVVAAANGDEIALDSDDDDDDDDVGPAPVTTQSSAPLLTKRVHGPAAPPAPLSEKPTDDPNPNPSSDSDSDDDDYGPALPTSTSHQQRHLQAARLGVFSSQNTSSTTSKAPQRDDWMLAPPSAGGGYSASDPTKIKNRKFNSGPRVGNKEAGNGEISSIWTETPEEKRKRLENAVLGRGDGGVGTGAGGTQKRTTTVTTTTMAMAGNQGPGAREGQQARIREYTESTRGRSLYEEHQQSRGDGKGSKGSSSSSSSSSKLAKKEEEEEEEDDPSKRAFDKEKDMKLGGRIGTAQRRELLNRAADFGGRFAKGKYL